MIEEAMEKPPKYGKVVFFEENDNHTFDESGITAMMPFGVALNVYAEVPNPASQLIEGDTEEEIDSQIRVLLENMQDPDWLDENLFPYL